MNGMEILVAEHDNIFRFNCVVRSACQKILEGNEICDNDFRSMIDFVRNYADKHHHGKEEQILFTDMTTYLGKIAENLIRHGMLVEHDLARLHIADLEDALNKYKSEPSEQVALDIISSAVGYTKLLQRHIDKENQVVYTYAEKNLPHNILSDVNARMEASDKQAEKYGLQKKYLTILEELEAKYL